MKKIPFMILTFLMAVCVCGALEKHDLIESSRYQIKNQLDRAFSKIAEASNQEINYHKVLDCLFSNCEVIEKGDDKDIRPVFVTVQAEIEKYLANALLEGEIHSLVGVIHTPTPATPLCTSGKLTESLLHDSIKDFPRVYTVISRADIIQFYLQSGGVLVAAYPEGGEFKRSQEQRSIYEENLDKHPKALLDRKLSCVSLEADLVGATYVFKSKDNQQFAFSIMASQANAPEDQKQWGLWYGPICDSKINSRTKRVFEYLERVGNLDLKAFIEFE